MLDASIGEEREFLEDSSWKLGKPEREMLFWCERCGPEGPGEGLVAQVREVWSLKAQVREVRA